MNEKEYYCIDCDEEFDWVDIVDGARSCAVCPECGELLANSFGSARRSESRVYNEAFNYPEPAFRAEEVSVFMPTGEEW